MPSRRNRTQVCSALAPRGTEYRPPRGTAEYQVLGTRYQPHPLQTRNPQPGTRNRLRAAFTLIELMIVVVIAVILLAVTLPTVKYSLEEGKLREGARQFNAMFATAKAQATATGRPAGVWLELERIGDPSTPLGLYQCSQLYLAEVPAPYGGDVLNARAVIRNAPGDSNNLQTNPAPQIPYNPANANRRGWLIEFTNYPASVGLLFANPGALVEPGEAFGIRFDGKGHTFQGIRSNVQNANGNYDYYVINSGVVPPRANGIYDPMTNPNAGYSFQIFRQPERTGQPLELPQGIVIDIPYSGAGPSDNQFWLAKGRVLLMFSPGGGVASTSVIDQTNGNVVEDVGSSKIFFLVGKTEKMEFAWNTATVQLADHNIADGSNLWVVVNRRNGSVATVENTPDPTAPLSNPITGPEAANFLTLAREFARTSEVKGGQ